VFLASQGGEEGSQTHEISLPAIAQSDSFQASRGKKSCLLPLTNS
jgi:hypothetical protein